jgi:hypothetical protein
MAKFPADVPLSRVIAALEILGSCPSPGTRIGVRHERQIS